MFIDNLSQLKALKLFGMATALAEIRAETPRLALTPDGCLTRLIDAELEDRQARSLRYISLVLQNSPFIGIWLPLSGRNHRYLKRKYS